MSKATTTTLVGLDFETRNLKIYKPIVWSLTVTTNGKKAHVFTNANGLRKSDVPAWVWNLFTDPSVTKIAHNAVFDGSICLSAFGVRIRNIACTQCQETVIQGRALPPIKKKNRTPEQNKLYAKYGVALDDTFRRYGFPVPNKDVREGFIDRPLGIAFTKPELKYMPADVLPLLQLYKAQRYILRRDELESVADLENAKVEKNIIAKVRGCGFDGNIWRKVAVDNGREYERRLSKLPQGINWGSEKQVKAFFRREYNIIIPTYTSKHPDIDDLDSLYLKTRNKTLGEFILARELNKAVTSYGLSWFENGYIDDDGRIRPDVRQIIETGRSAYSNPNLQQLPGMGRQDYLHDEVMKILYAGEPKVKPQHRRAFIPTPGNAFNIGDFTGQELGIMAAAAEEKLWIDAMLRGDDIHGLTASLLYADEWNKGADRGCGFPKKCKCPGHYPPRQRAKILNFMLAYGGGATRFQRATGLSNLDARITIARYKKIIPNLTRYLERNGNNASNTGESYSADPYRRRRVIEGDRSVTQGKNNPIQAAGANMLKLAAISIPDKYYCPLEIHDEIILEVPIQESATALKVLENVMNKSADYITGIKGLIKAEVRTAMNIMKDAGTPGFDLYGNKLTKK